VDRCVREYGVGYFKFDYNIDGGTGTEVGADSFGDGLLEHNRAYLTWIDEVIKKYPDLIIENCSSGGMCADYAMLAKHHIQSTSDQEDYRHTAVIAANAATAVLPEQAAVWSYPMQAHDSTAVAFNMVGPMLQRIHLSGEIHLLSDDQFALVKEGVECYKAVRGDISTGMPFYPMGLPQYGDGWLCRGLKSEARVYLAVWRLDAQQDTVTIPLDMDASDARICYPACNTCKLEADAEGITLTMGATYSAVLIAL